MALDLRALTGRGARIAVVDSGIDGTHPDVGPLLAGYGLTLDGDRVVESSDTIDRYGHGTACAALIRRLAPEVELVPIKIGDRPESLSPRVLAAGIAKAVALDVDVVHVAAGVTGHQGADVVTRALEEAALRRIAVVAAESNTDEPALPASSALAIAAAGGERSMRSHALGIDPRDPRRIRAYAGLQRLAWIEPRHVFAEGTSFATPRVAAAVALIIAALGRLERSALLEQLRLAITPEPRAGAPARRATAAPVIEQQPIRAAALYPFSKELHGLVRFRDLTGIAITGVVDTITSGRVGKDVGALLGEPDLGVRVTSRLEEAIEGADTLILGYRKARGAHAGRDVGGELAERAIAMGKHVYAFEPFDRAVVEAARARGLEVRWPRVTEGDLARLREGPRGDASAIPIVGVFGTGPAQGKVTVQMALRRGLVAGGYRPALVGTEHQSWLLGMEACFPIGHASNVEIPLDRWREWFALTYAALAHRHAPELFVVGSQSGLVPYTLATSEPGTLTLRTVLTLMATRPDRCVLTVSLDDDPAFIAQHLEALRSFGKSETVALAALPELRRVERGRPVRVALSPDEATARRAALAERFERPVLDTLDAAGLARAVIDGLAAAG